MESNDIKFKIMKLYHGLHGKSLFEFTIEMVESERSLLFTNQK